jgi:hypothetical protein
LISSYTKGETILAGSPGRHAVARRLNELELALDAAMFEMALHRDGDPFFDRDRFVYWLDCAEDAFVGAIMIATGGSES